MVEIVLIDVDGSPLDAVVLVDGDDADGIAVAGEVAFPEFRGPWFANDVGLAGVLTVRLLPVNAVSAVGLL